MKESALEKKNLDIEEKYLISHRDNIQPKPRLPLTRVGGWGEEDCEATATARPIVIYLNASDFYHGSFSAVSILIFAIKRSTLTLQNLLIASNSAEVSHKFFLGCIDDFSRSRAH